MIKSWIDRLVRKANNEALYLVSTTRLVMATSSLAQS